MGFEGSAPGGHELAVGEVLAAGLATVAAPGVPVPAALTAAPVAAALIAAASTALPPSRNRVRTVDGYDRSLPQLSTSVKLSGKPTVTTNFAPACSANSSAMSSGLLIAGKVTAPTPSCRVRRKPGA